MFLLFDLPGMAPFVVDFRYCFNLAIFPILNIFFFFSSLNSLYVHTVLESNQNINTIPRDRFCYFVSRATNIGYLEELRQDVSISPFCSLLFIIINVTEYVKWGA